MAQRYKAVYFTDFPSEDSKQRSVTLAFGPKSNEVFESVRDLSSEEIRQLLGTDSYNGIVDAAHAEDLPLNLYCVRQLKRSLKLIGETNRQLTLPGLGRRQYIFDPVSVTFKGGSQEPFVRWYPYLQGYSPQFVQAILQKYAPDAKLVLDPFAGTGTTAFVASRLNIKACFCEINPVLQFVCLAKIRVMKLKTAQRFRLFDELIERTRDLENIETFEQDSRINESYGKCFGSSTFFDEDVYEQVLRIRSWIDHVSLEKTADS